MNLKPIPKNKSFSFADLIYQNLSNRLQLKKGNSLENEEQKNIINKLFSCKDYLLCPFQKKIILSISKSELQNKFL